MKHSCAALFFASSSWMSTFCHATYSIVGTDSTSQQVGGAGASCVVDMSIKDALYRGVAGKGVLHTQALALEADSPATTTAMSQIGTEPPETILETMRTLDNGTEFADALGMAPGTPNYEFRQNAIVDLTGAYAAYTGPSIEPLYEMSGYVGTTQEHLGGSLDNFAYSAQGNAVTATTVDALIAGFTGGGCDLTDRLMNAVASVSSQNQGDERCIKGEFEPTTISGVPAAGAFIKVEAADGTVVIDLDVPGDGSMNPTDELQAKYDEWRAGNPCPSSHRETSAPGGGADSSDAVVGTMLMSLMGTGTALVLLFA